MKYNGVRASQSEAAKSKRNITIRISDFATSDWDGCPRTQLAPGDFQMGPNRRSSLATCAISESADCTCEQEQRGRRGLRHCDFLNASGGIAGSNPSTAFAVRDRLNVACGEEWSVAAGGQAEETIKVRRVQTSDSTDQIRDVLAASKGIARSCAELKQNVVLAVAVCFECIDPFRNRAVGKCRNKDACGRADVALSVVLFGRAGAAACVRRSRRLQRRPEACGFGPTASRPLIRTTRR